ncbi:methylmalonic aciduria and homocystinuria type D homolog, mitochondrial [Eupeodes corollae]|uniref:methylmalonic aciduria and homocystinuria type D homolog, mitochondrial n=1 Tax=Eupeodes corollae TaxID=290404 RepID=UPI002491856C|nr:methylmalonic aciduria and homocystinuria type D homolog, mitochondrial [Eupeodes corollae]
MSNTILRTLSKINKKQLLTTSQNNRSLLTTTSSTALYSRRSDPKDYESAFKVVKSKVRVEENGDFLGGECGPNWELLSPRGNRFYFPNSVGPAWQSASTTIPIEVPLENLVDFEGQIDAKLKFSVDECPSLIKKNLHELFPAPEVVSSEKLSLMTLKYDGDIEQGASKFVLAAREITSRLRLHGYWADFMNPFSGKPFYSWSSGKNLYKIDDRFRGIGMKLISQNNCIIISSDKDSAFSGAIYSNAPSNFDLLKSLIDEQV